MKPHVAVEGFEMGELVDALVRVLEFVVQGALAVLLIGFVLAWVHAIKTSVYEHAREMTEYMLGQDVRRLKPHPNVLIAITIGLLYIAGVITNSVGYWLLYPAHELVIAAAVPSSPTDHPTSVPASDLVRVVTTRVVLGSSPAFRREYVDYLNDEVAWRNTNLDAVKHALDPLLKQSRVIRGTAVISLGFLLISLAKAISFFICLLLLFLPGRFHRAGEALYRSLVDPKHGGVLPSVSKSGRVKRLTTIKYAVSNVIYAAVSFVVLWCSLGGYATTEREYHIMAHAGKVSAAAQK